jgi:hypothetical protein
VSNGIASIVSPFQVDLPINLNTLYHDGLDRTRPILLSNLDLPLGANKLRCIICICIAQQSQCAL